MISYVLRTKEYNTIRANPSKVACTMQGKQHAKNNPLTVALPCGVSSLYSATVIQMRVIRIQGSTPCEGNPLCI
ncbi:hypothetical protein QGX15_gp001 [Pseudomonas phage psageK4e]|uniref:Uncharacterized protein n=1 Tax=Pseudomonas phage psageK4e TaxID=2875723 RepID=A0AAE8XLP1_9CAUD|nr:hypothetical protein QGX15_gp001 [Pseudomonas phage psageK4e]UAW53449.1 hypothetical protein psageK4e_001 [Pseudomonas phage psageK4e]